MEQLGVKKKFYFSFSYFSWHNELERNDNMAFRNPRLYYKYT